MAALSALGNLRGSRFFMRNRERLCTTNLALAPRRLIGLSGVRQRSDQGQALAVARKRKSMSMIEERGRRAQTRLWIINDYP